MNNKSSNNFVLQARNITKSFSRDSEKSEVETRILHDACIEIKNGETIAIVGSSGCGKTTLLHILALIDKPDSGSLFICGCNCLSATEREKNTMLSCDISLIYQFHHLLQECSILENVSLPLLISGIKESIANGMAIETLSSLGLIGKINNMPSELSGGERQRVAIARAIVKQPKIIFADEPTGSLDPKIGSAVFETLIDRAKSIGAALVCVTHNHELAKKLEKQMTIVNGQIVEQKL